MDNIINHLSLDSKRLLEGTIAASKLPKIELDTETKTITLTLFKNTYFNFGLVTYHLKEDKSGFISYEDGNIVYVLLNTNTLLVSGRTSIDNLSEDCIVIGYLLISNGNLEYCSWYSIDRCSKPAISISAHDSIVISVIQNKILFPYHLTIQYNGKITSVEEHPDISLSGYNDIVSLYYNHKINRFVVSSSNADDLTLIATYDKKNSVLGYNLFPGMICVEDNIKIPDYKIAKWSYNYNDADKSIEWPEFYAMNTTDGTVQTIPSDSIELFDKLEDAKFGNHLIIFNPNTYSVEVLHEPEDLPTNAIILDAFEYTLGGFKTTTNTVNGLLPLQNEVNKINKLLDEKVLEADNRLFLAGELYLVNDNPILKSSMTVSGSADNTITVIDASNNISYPDVEVRFDSGAYNIYSGDDGKTLQVFKYTSAEANKDYKFGFISRVALQGESRPLPGKVVFDRRTTRTFEELVGINSSNGHSPFMRIAGSLDKENYPAWCFRKTGAKNELSYALSSNKSGDFYIFDLRYYLLSNGLNDNDPLTHIIINAGSEKNSTTLEAIKILYTLIHDAYPHINIGFVPMVSHGLRDSNTHIVNNKKTCNLVNEIMNLIKPIGADYRTSVLPMWLYVNPMVSNETARIHEAWNCIVGWACCSSI